MKEGRKLEYQEKILVDGRSAKSKRFALIFCGELESVALLCIKMLEVLWNLVHPTT